MEYAKLKNWYIIISVQFLEETIKDLPGTCSRIFLICSVQYSLSEFERDDLYGIIRTTSDFAFPRPWRSSSNFFVCKLCNFSSDLGRLNSRLKSPVTKNHF